MPKIKKTFNNIELNISVKLSLRVIFFCEFPTCSISVHFENKKAMLSQGNRAMPAYAAVNSDRYQQPVGQKQSE